MPIREVLAYFGAEVDDSELKKFDTSIGSTKKLLGDLGKALALTAVFSGVKGFVSEMVDLGMSIKQATQKTGLSAQQWQQWTYAADVAGVSSEQLGTAFRMLFKNAETAAEGGKKASKSFSGIGVDVKDSSGHLKDSNQLFLESIAGLKKIENPAERSARAMQIFGRSGTALIPLLEKSPEQLAELSARFAELGGGVTDDALKALEEQHRATADWDLALTGLKSTVSTEILPAITWLVTKGADLISWFRQATQGSHLFQAALIVLGVESALLAAPLIAPWLPFIAIIGAAILIVDLLLSIFGGGESIVGSFFKKIEQSKWFQQLEDGAARAKRAFVNLGAAIRDEVASWGGKILDGLEAAWTSMVDFFVTKGEQIWDGFVEGLEKGWKKVQDWLMDHIPGLKGIFNTAADAHSPARITIDPGENLIAGYALGMQNMIPAVKKQAGAAVNAGVPDPSALINNNLFTPSVPASRSSSMAVDVRQTNHISQEFHGVAANAMSDTMRSSVLGVAADDRRAMMADLEALGGDDGD